jgi:hypothetical protein
MHLMLLPGFQKGRDIKEKGREQFWQNKGILRRKER